MFKIFNNREHFFQWDLNQKLIVEDKTIKQVHYCNRTGDYSLPVECYELDGLWVAEVPNELLQQAYILRVWAVCGDYTKIEERFKVVAKTKPTDYVYTQTEVKRYDDLEQKIEAALSDEVISEAVSEYLVENPPQAVDLTPYALKTDLPNLEPYALKTDIPATPDLTNYATKQDVAEAVAAIEVPEVNLEPYALKSEIPDTSGFALKSEIPATPDLSKYALKSEIPTVPDTSNFITMPQVEQKGYQTEDEVNTLINNALGVIENGTY